LHNAFAIEFLMNVQYANLSLIKHSDTAVIRVWQQQTFVPVVLYPFRSSTIWRGSIFRWYLIVHVNMTCSNWTLWSSSSLARQPLVDPGLL